ncbi:hypothetical protein GO496_04210 [Acidovorax citrulli]|nr:hypothetical protein [Paracidovorax citrulli]
MAHMFWATNDTSGTDETGAPSSFCCVPGPHQLVQQRPDASAQCQGPSGIAGQHRTDRAHQDGW